VADFVYQIYISTSSPGGGGNVLRAIAGRLPPFSVKIRKSWCPLCANNLPHGTEKMQSLAHAKGGKCLSKEYRNSKTPLMWRCKNGHRFLATADSVVQDKWCNKCEINV
tara:strand:- start:689 stop:1015 length:327 start_codon:yes stop_codon:yes gene_type:complete